MQTSAKHFGLEVGP